MSILSEDSVGDVIYQVIDDLYPVHSAETGTVAIAKYGTGIFTSVAPYDWTVNIKDQVSGEMYSYDNALNDGGLAAGFGLLWNVFGQRGCANGLC